MLLASLSQSVSSFQRMLHVSPLTPHHSSNSCPHSNVDARNTHVQNRVLQLVESDRSLNSLHEDDNLVDFESIHKIVEVSVLLFLSQLRMILEKTVQK